MNSTLYKEVNYDVSKLIDDIEIGDIGLPDIQRPFVWPKIKVRDLFDSMYKGFPIGYLLFWENGFASNSKQIGGNVKQKSARLLIVDGQQRLTSLFAVIKAKQVISENFSYETIKIAFNPISKKFEVCDAAIEKDPEWISNISNLWSSNKGLIKFANEYLCNLKISWSLTEEQENEISQAIQDLYDLKKYPLTALELSSNIDEEKVADIFVRINSMGTQLNQSNFILTLMSVYWDEGRKQLESFCQNARTPSKGIASPFNYIIEPDPDQLLRVTVGISFKRARLRLIYLLLRGKDLETEVFSEGNRIMQFEILKNSQNYALDINKWHEYLNIVSLAGCRNKNMVSSKIGLLYTYIHYLIGRRDFDCDTDELRNIISKWFFMQSLTGRYTGSQESTMESDLSRLKNIDFKASAFIDTLQKIIDDNLTEDYWNITLPNQLSTAASISPALNAYNSSLVILKAKGLFSNLDIETLFSPGIHSRKTPLERHHLFPKAFLVKNGITNTSTINQIANYALVEWWKNIEISDENPSVYWNEYLSKFNPTDDQLKQIHYWHALPENWSFLDYNDFLEKRRILMAKVIKDAYQLIC